MITRPKHIPALLILTFSLLVALAESAVAQEKIYLTLNEALAAAYAKNPDIKAARARLKSVDENYAQALAGFQPTINGEAAYVSSHQGTGGSDPKTIDLALSQPLYNGGSTLASVRQAEENIKAERARLKLTEQQVLLDAVIAYMTLLRDQEIAELNANNEKVLANHLAAAQERFNLGDVTKTDVSQAQSRYDRAVSSRISAEGEMKKSLASFEKIIGLVPQGLQKPGPDVALPPTEADATAQALGNNPSVVLAQFNEKAARAGTRVIEGENLPQVALTSSVGRAYDPAASIETSENTSSIGIRAIVPLYAGGATMSRIRQSRHVENQLRMLTQSALDSAREAAIRAWEGVAAANAESKALQSQIDASALALEGVRVEMSYGTRTTLDLLDAQQEYLTAQVSYVAAEANRIVASYSLLAAIGRLTAQDLKLNVPIYDPVKNFQNVKGRTFNAPFHGDQR